MRPHRCRGPVLCWRIRLQINAAHSGALCCRLFPLIPSHDRCTKRLLALFRSEVLATNGRFLLPRPETGRRFPGPSGPRRCAPSVARQHVFGCVRGSFASATRTSIGGLRVRIPASHVPGLAAACTCRLMTTLLAPAISRRLSDRSHIFVVAPSLRLPAVQSWRGVRPSVMSMACFQHDALMAWVRCRIRSLRTRNTIAAPSVFSLFTGTNRIVRRPSRTQGPAPAPEERPFLIENIAKPSLSASVHLAMGDHLFQPPKAHFRDGRQQKIGVIIKRR